MKKKCSSGGQKRQTNGKMAKREYTKKQNNKLEAEGARQKCMEQDNRSYHGPIRPAVLLYIHNV